jgi:hypothetical protein
MKVEIFYHICAKAGEKVLNIINEQLTKIKESKLYERVDKINCCLVGDDINNFKYLIEKIPSMGEKFKIVKCSFNDKTFEIFTASYLRENIEEEGYYLYLHSKGVTKTWSEPIRDWRRCMEYFLIQKADKCLEKLKEGYDTVGIMKLNNYGPCFAGNFWWATGKYLKKLFQEKELKPGYYTFEYYLLTNEPKYYDIYNVWKYYPNYDGYHHLLPIEMYENIID